MFFRLIKKIHDVLGGSYATCFEIENRDFSALVVQVPHTSYTLLEFLHFDKKMNVVSCICTHPLHLASHPSVNSSCLNTYVRTTYMKQYNR